MPLRLAAITAVGVSIALGSAGTAQASVNTDKTPAAVAQANIWQPVAAYWSYAECANVAAQFAGYAYCTYEGGSYPWVLWVWTS